MSATMLLLLVGASSAQNIDNWSGAMADRLSLMGFPGWSTSTGWSQPLLPTQQALLTSVCQSATGVVIGTVTAVRSEWRTFSFGTVIASHAVVEVERNIHGSAQPEVTISYLGGRVGTVVMTSSEDPVLTPGERYLLLFAPIVDSSIEAPGSSAGIPSTGLRFVRRPRQLPTPGHP